MGPRTRLSAGGAVAAEQSLLSKPLSPQREQMMDSSLFDTIRDEIPGYIDAAIGRVDGSRFECGAGTLTECQAQILSLVQSFTDTYEALGGSIDFGSNEEALLSASRGYLLLRIDRSRRFFVAVQLSSNGNVGYLRFRARRYLRDAAAALGAA